MNTNLNWIACANQLPTEADEDLEGMVRAHYENGTLELLSSEEVLLNLHMDDVKITFWQPTGEPS